tara:strand:+ start:1435 stop:1728 length:294 start_codon:yes stop_codon:yes gene_type:complete
MKSDKKVKEQFIEAYKYAKNKKNMSTTTPTEKIMPQFTDKKGVVIRHLDNVVFEGLEGENITIVDNADTGVLWLICDEADFNVILTQEISNNLIVKK